MDDPTVADRFIDRWASASGSERANHQLFVADLCHLLGVPTPDPVRDDTRDDAYVFERRVTFAHGDGSSTPGFIDGFRRVAFALEAKKVEAASHTEGFDGALMRARAQAEATPARRPPPKAARPSSASWATRGAPLTTDDLAARFTARGRWRDRLPTILETLQAIGRVRRTGDTEAPAWAAG